MNSEINYVSPFKRFCITIGNLPTAYIESMSYYEGLTFLVNYLANNVIPALNNNGQVVEELQEKFVELKNFVDTYFENLDVQEEINNKLDEMADDGTLATLLNNYTMLTKVYNTHYDMEIDDSMVNNSKVKTLGYYDINDGGGAEYYITDVLPVGVYYETYNGNYYILLNNEEVSVKQLGAKGDNDNDDTTAFQTAISNYKKIYVPSGTYLIDTELVLTNSSLLYGDGYNSIIKSTASNVISYTSDVQIIMSSIKGIRFIGDDTNTCLNFVRSDSSVSLVRSTFEDLYITNFLTGLHTRYNWTNKFKNVSFHGTPQPLLLETQTNAIDFDTCTLTGTDDTNEVLCSILTRCQAINFNNCNIASKHYFNFRNLSEITFNDCYIEEVYNDKFFRSGLTDEKGNYITINHCHGYKENPLEIYLLPDSNNELIINSLFNEFVIKTDTLSSQKIKHNYLSEPSIKNLLYASNKSLITTAQNLYLNEIDGFITNYTNSRHLIMELDTPLPTDGIVRVEMIYSLSDYTNASYLQFLDSLDNVVKQTLIPSTQNKMKKAVYEFYNTGDQITKIKISNANSSYNNFNFNYIAIVDNGDIEFLLNKISKTIYTDSTPTFTPVNNKLIVNDDNGSLYIYTSSWTNLT